MENEAYWSDAWRRHIDDYLAAPPRLSYWLAQRFPDRGLSLLQLAAGSCRDSIRLAEMGYDSIGTDFDHSTLDYIRERFPQYRDKVRHADAFDLDMPDRSVDVTVSNGFWVLFDDDEKVVQLLREQVRVSRRFAVFVTQNGENPRLRRAFAELKKSDNLYDIRFFTRVDIRRLVAASGVRYKSIKMHPFGGAPDLLFDRRIKGIPNPLRGLAPRLAARLYALLPWRKAERIITILEV